MMKRNLLSAAFALMALAVSADEGMWMLTDLKAQNEAAMMDLGLQIPIEEVLQSGWNSFKRCCCTFRRRMYR